MWYFETYEFLLFSSSKNINLNNIFFLKECLTYKPLIYKKLKLLSETFQQNQSTQKDVLKNII